jgi:hypothetical protein
VKHESYNGAVSAKVIFCITRAYQAKLPAWSEPTYTRSYGSTTSSQPVNNTPNMPNEYVHTAPPQHQMKFDAFSF